MNQTDKVRLNLVNEWRESSLDANDFLYKFFSGYKNGIDFVDSSAQSLKLSGRALVWWCGMIHNYHQHPDYTVENLLKTRKHFKNIALRYLNDQQYGVFKTWIDNWSNLLIVTNHLDPSLWENHPSRHETA